MARRVTPRMAGLRPGTSPPPVRMPMTPFFVLTLAMILESPLFETLNPKLSLLKEFLGRGEPRCGEIREQLKKSSIKSRNCIGQGVEPPLDWNACYPQITAVGEHAGMGGVQGSGHLPGCGKFDDRHSLASAISRSFLESKLPVWNRL